MKAILLVSHGSRSAKARQEVFDLAERLKKESCFSVLEVAFLEVEKPDILDGFSACVEKGATEIIVLQNFLNSGNHVLKDIPRCLKEASCRYPGIKFHIKPFVGSHPRLKDLFLDLVSTPSGDPQ